jgi:hypothetical protein
MKIEDILLEQEACQAVIDDIQHQHEMAEMDIENGIHRPKDWWLKSKYVITCNNTRLKTLVKQEKMYLEEMKLQRHLATMAVKDGRITHERNAYQDAITAIEDVLTNHGDNPMIREIINALDAQLEDLMAETGVCE